MKYAAATGVLLASLAFETVDVACAQQGPLPPVTIYGPKPVTGQQAESAAQKSNAAKRKKRTARRPVPPPPAGAPASATSTSGVHNAATNPQYNTETVSLGPLGNRKLLDTPFSVTAIPQDLIENLQLKTVNDTLRYLPSVEIRNQQGFEVSRPQSRGFQGSVVQATRLDGLNIIGTTAIPAENLSGIQVLNGLAGSLYGPATPAGVFNYTLKRPTDVPFATYTQGFDSNSVFTENIDAGGRTPDGTVGYRFNVVHGQGESYAPESHTDRTLASGALDFHIGDRTVVETNFSHYQTNITGLPGSIVYFGKPSIVLPNAVDPTRLGYGQPGAGTDLVTDTGLVKVKHEINNDWNIEIGGLYQDAVRNLFGITNTLTDNLGNYTVTKNFNAVPHFTIASNTASLNGRFDLFGFRNELTIGTNGFFNGQYSYRNSIATDTRQFEPGRPRCTADTTYPVRWWPIQIRHPVQPDDRHRRHVPFQRPVGGARRRQHVFPAFGKFFEDRRCDQPERRKWRRQSNRQPDLQACLASDDICHIRQKRRTGRASPRRDSQCQSVSCAISGRGVRGRPQIRYLAEISRHLRFISHDAPARGNRSGLEHLRGGRHPAQQRRRVFRPGRYYARAIDLRRRDLDRCKTVEHRRPLRPTANWLSAFPSSKAMLPSTIIQPLCKASR